MTRRRLRDLRSMALLCLLPVVADAPAWWHERLLGPGDGAALHLPLRAETWEAYRRGEVPSWNPTIFCGTPLLAAYRGGAFYPPMAALSALHPFLAFQLLVLGSLGAAGVLLFAYVRRLGGSPVGAYVSGISFSLGPYLVGHLDDTATLVASPLLPLVLLAAESHMNRGGFPRAMGLAAATALLLLAGSPEAARAGAALVAGRLVVGHWLFPRKRGPSVRLSLGTLAAGVGLSAPQVLPTLLAIPEAGRQVTGLAATGDAALPGLTGLVLRYVSHTPAAALALAALPLAATQMPVRVLGAATALCLAFQWGRGPLAAPGALALVFDLTLAILAGLALSAQTQARLDPLGARLRGYFLVACLVSAAALSVSAVAIGPLPEVLAGAVGVLALSLILYFSFATSHDELLASAWLLPLTVSFLLQPHGRQVWSHAPTRAELFGGTPTRSAIDRIMGQRRSERILTLTREWPSAEVYDLAHAGLGAFSGRRSAEGYDPMVPLRTRRAFGGMGPGGALLGAFLRSDPVRLESLGVRWVQVPSSALKTAADRWGMGDTLDLMLEAGQPRFFPLPIAAATELRLGTWLAESVGLPDETTVARVEIRLASGRHLSEWLRAGRHTAEWAYDRVDVRPRVAHRRAPVLESWPGAGGGFDGHRYLATLPLNGRYLVDGIGIERLPGPWRLAVGRLGAFDTATGVATPVSLAGGYVSDLGSFREVAATPLVWLFELPRSPGHARVVAELKVLADEAAILAALEQPKGSGLDLRRQALIAAAEPVAEPVRPAGGQASRASVLRARGNLMEIRAAGPGWLIVTESWDPGWSARVDGGPARVVRVNHAQMAVALGSGTHRVTLEHRAQGLLAGLALSGLAGGALALGWARSGRSDG